MDRQQWEPQFPVTPGDSAWKHNHVLWWNQEVSGTFAVSWDYGPRVCAILDKGKGNTQPKAEFRVLREE